MRWADVIGYEDSYEVSDSGLVRSKTRVVVDSKCIRTFKGKELNLSINPTGYHYVTLSLNGNRLKRLVHRLVAEAFIPNPENKPQVNHVDGNPLNNSVDNLEWCTNAENTKHAYVTGLNKGNQKLITFNGKTQNMRTWETELGLPHGTISMRIKYGWSIEKCLTTKDGRKTKGNNK